MCMTDEQKQAALAGMMAVHMDNMRHFRADPEGDCPKCKPRIWTNICVRCGQKIGTADGACPAVPKKERWTTLPPTTRKEQGRG